MLPKTIADHKSTSVSVRPHMLLSSLIALILLFDQILIYGLSAVLGRGGGAGSLVLIFAMLAFYKHRHSTLGLTFFVLGTCGFVAQVNHFVPNQLYVTSIAVLTLYICCLETKLFMRQTKVFYISLWVVLFFHILSRLGFDLFEYVSFREANRPTGLYSEPSHLAYYVVMIYFFAIKAYPEDRQICAIPAVIVLLLNFSLTAVLPLILILQNASKTRKLRKKLWLTLGSAACMIFVFSLNFEYIKERNIFSTADEKTLTVQVLLYYYLALAYFSVNNFFIGFGPDRFYDAYISFANASFPMPGDLNSTDGSFLFVKLTGEFGLMSALIFLIAVFRRINSDSYALLLIFLQYLLLRGFGITSVIPVSFLLLAMMVNRRDTYK